MENKKRRREEPWRILLGDVTPGTNFQLRRATSETVENLQKLLQVVDALEAMIALLAKISYGSMCFSEGTIRRTSEEPPEMVIMVKIFLMVVFDTLEFIFKGYVDRGSQLISRMETI